MNNKFDFSYCDYWEHLDDDTIIHVITKEMYQSIRKAFFSLNENAKSVLYYYVIKEMYSDNTNLNKYVIKLKEKFLEYYGYN